MKEKFNGKDFNLTYEDTGIEVVERYRWYLAGDDGTWSKHKVYSKNNRHYFITEDDDTILYRIIVDTNSNTYCVISYEYDRVVEEKGLDGSAHKYGFVWTEIA